MLKYTVVPLLLIALAGCGPKGSHKKNHMRNASNSVVSDSQVDAQDLDSGTDDVVVTGMNEYYGCPSSGPIAVVNFDFDKSVVSESAKDVLSEAYFKCVHNYLRDNSEAKLLLTGHTDRHGSVEYNVALGSRRSDAVSREMQNIASHHPGNSYTSSDGSSDHSGFLSKNKHCVTSKGKEEILYPPSALHADAKNRRVVLEFAPDGRCE